jgi:transaldolase/glucose-6-phosphate isomerase
MEGTAMPNVSNPLTGLTRLGQSVWYDNIRRGLVRGGELARLVAQDSVRGVTSNPAIFEKAIAGSTDYDDALRQLDAARDCDAAELYERLAVDDVQRAADVLRPVYDGSEGRDGFVSLEVSPYLAHDTEGTIREAVRLWSLVDRANAMIKIPATDAGIAALPAVVAEGINTNVTLLFSRQTFERVGRAHWQGLEQRAAAGLPLSHVASVASFFVSRVDAAIQARIAKGRRTLPDLRGSVAIANAKLAYARWHELYASARWSALAALGAQPQRLLWASTGAKDPTMRDVVYVEELIGPFTVNTMPAATLDAFRDHGVARATLEADRQGAEHTLAALAHAGISLEEVAAELLTEGLSLFTAAADKLLGAVERKRQATLGALINRQSVQLPADVEAKSLASVAAWTIAGRARRLWARDASLWTGGDESRWMGWLGVADDHLAHRAVLDAVARDVRGGGFDHVVLLGMGGSSLCPDVLRATFGRRAGWPEFLVLDSTDPAQIADVEARIDLRKTLFIVSSKSGTTLEPDLLLRYFFDRVLGVLGAAEAGDRFVAITDPGSPLEKEATARDFRATHYGSPSIGGRYSALSNFGMIPAAAMGIGAPEFLERAADMVNACAACVPPEQNPGVLLGIALGECARTGRDKLTIVASESVAAFGAWLEQLVAESLGKLRTGIVPVEREPIGSPSVYDQDRIFAYLRVDDDPSESLDAAVERLRAAGHPVITIALADPSELGEEFFRWEIATAVAASLLGVNPFDQPDVEASKIETRRLCAAYEARGELPAQTPILHDQGITLYADTANARALSSRAARATLVGYLRAHLERLGRGDYFALLAYLKPCENWDAELQAMRLGVRDAKRVATCLEYGPRFLHSTGQVYKGGPNTGVFLQVTCDNARDLQVPGTRLSFGVVKDAQARADFAVLGAGGRRALHVHLANPQSALPRLRRAVQEALLAH